jgi:hypothetical protein
MGMIVTGLIAFILLLGIITVIQYSGGKKLSKKQKKPEEEIVIKEPEKTE